VKANHTPSEENAAPSPTTVTPLTIARAAAVGSGVIVGIGDGSVVGATLGDSVAGGLDGAIDVVGLGVGVSVGAAVVGLALGAVVGLGDADASGSPGSATTKIWLPPEPSAPTTTAWLFAGEVMIDLGDAAIVTRRPARSSSAAQLARATWAQTWSTFATL
jgi:hypothetical protein